MHLVLETEAIRGLFDNAGLLATFPFLQQAKQSAGPSGGCNCGRKKQDIDWNAVKSEVARLSPENRIRFKQLAGATTVSVPHRVGNEVKIESF